MLKNHKKLTKIKTILLAFTLLATTTVTVAKAEDNMPKFAIALHGGAGTILKGNMTPELEAEYRAKLLEALTAGHDILAEGGSSVDAVETAIVIMEDSPLFNAGHGAVFTSEGKNELDASIMDGSDLNAGAVSGVRIVKNPISLARAVMENSNHVMLQSDGAESFAASQENIEIVDPEYFYTERRYNQLMRVREMDEGTVISDHDGDHKFGTVGIAALDQHGNLAAGTSTGGMTNKSWGRVGDTPIIGAGTYANNASCAVSATGAGEYFIRATVARNICALMEYKGLSLQEAADEVVMKQLVDMGGEGGIISVDKDGNVALVFNTKGMYRGSWVSGGEPHIGIYEDD